MNRPQRPQNIHLALRALNYMTIKYVINVCRKKKNKSTEKHLTDP